MSSGQNVFLFNTGEGIDVPVRIEQSRRFRRCSLRVNEQGVRLTMPVGYPEKSWRAFLETHSKWIADKYRLHTERREQLPELKLGEKIPFKGGWYHLESANIAAAEFSESSFLIPEKDFSTGNEKTVIYQSLMRAYVFEAFVLTGQLIEKWREHLTGISVVRLKEMRTRWGSCSSKGSIALNWRLVMAGEDVFEYVFVHELSHIEEQNHGSRFWHNVEAKMPGAVELRHKLKEQNFLLMNFPFKANRVKTYATIPVD